MKLSNFQFLKKYLFVLYERFTIKVYNDALIVSEHQFLSCNKHCLIINTLTGYEIGKKRVAN